MSKRKSQISVQNVKFEGFLLNNETSFLASHTQAIQSPREPITKKDLREFLGIVGYCHYSIPNFTAITKHLCEALKGGNNSPLE